MVKRSKLISSLNMYQNAVGKISDSIFILHFFTLYNSILW